MVPVRFASRKHFRIIQSSLLIKSIGAVKIDGALVCVHLLFLLFVNHFFSKIHAAAVDSFPQGPAITRRLLKSYCVESVKQQTEVFKTGKSLCIK